MFGLSSEKLLILGIIAVFVLGPERLPTYAKQLANLVKNLRKMADGAKSQLQDELGDDFEDLDWKKLDPRQYDPRRIIREALSEDEGREGADLSKLATAAAAMPVVSASLTAGEQAPFDTEAT